MSEKPRARFIDGVWVFTAAMKSARGNLRGEVLYFGEGKTIEEGYWDLMVSIPRA